MTAKPRTSLRPVTSHVVVTGGCGFIGCNLVDSLASDGRTVVALDNLSRAGAEENAHWLKTRHGERVVIEREDVRDFEAVKSVVMGADAVLHLAAQVAVTTSLDDPIADF